MNNKIIIEFGFRIMEISEHVIHRGHRQYFYLAMPDSSPLTRNNFERANTAETNNNGHINGNQKDFKNQRDMRCFDNKNRSESLLTKS